MNFLEKLKKLIIEHRDELEAIEKELSENLEQNIKNEKFKTVDFQVTFEKEIKKSANGDYLVIKGIASTNSLDRDGEKVSIAGLKGTGINGRLPMLKQHNHEAILGHWYSWQLKEDKFVCEGRLYKKYDPTAYDMVLNGDLQALSIGFIINDYEKDVNGVYVWTDAELIEISVVTVGSNPDAQITSISKPNSEKESDAVVTKSTEGSEGESGSETPAKPAASEVETGATTEGEAEDTPESEVNTLEAKVQELQAQIDQLREEHSRVAQERDSVANELALLKTDHAELSELLSQSTEVIESQNEQLEKKYGLKN